LPPVSLSLFGRPLGRRVEVIENSSAILCFFRASIFMAGPWSWRPDPVDNHSVSNYSESTAKSKKSQEHQWFPNHLKSN
jgi:hypothetical protein